jgi:hypothetical protein
MMPLIGERERAVERLFEAARETWHSLSLRPTFWPPPAGLIFRLFVPPSPDHFFSMTHCKGW